MLARALTCCPYGSPIGGATIVTVDPHPQVRDPSDKSHWNEWGYLDYTLLDPRVESFQVSIVDFQSCNFDYVYSVSVIEHMPRKVRVQAIARMARLLGTDGVMLLSVDLIPRTDRLWNRSEGRVVDDPKVHGRLDDLQSEIINVGLTTTELEVIRGIEGSRTDIAFLVVRSPAVHSP
jgi:SAM-dependent methyltransferase